VPTCALALLLPVPCASLSLPAWLCPCPAPCPALPCLRPVWFWLLRCALRLSPRPLSAPYKRHHGVTGKTSIRMRTGLLLVPARCPPVRPSRSARRPCVLLCRRSRRSREGDRAQGEECSERTQTLHFTCWTSSRTCAVAAFNFVAHSVPLLFVPCACASARAVPRRCSCCRSTGCF
jgi:hypothetical protein